MESLDERRAGGSVALPNHPREPSARRRHGWGSMFGAAALLLFCSAGSGNARIDSIEELKKLTLEELLEMEVTSVSRRPEKLTETASAIHVITAEDIRRSGATGLPQALRLAPNLHVAQATSSIWAISARGFNAPFANKLLVLIDGRSVYSPLFSGVFWDVQDTMLEDIDRIEVISGPGASAWGANAVNGVINIISKNAKETQGVLVTGGLGTEEAFTGVRYGGKASDNLHYRIYTKYFNRDDTVLPAGDDAQDAWQLGQAGFRMDWEPHARNLLTFQGDLYYGDSDRFEDEDMTMAGGNLLARLTRSLDDSGEFKVQTYYDRTHRVVPGEFDDDLHTFDVDTQIGRDVGDRHHVMIGTGYRFTHNRVRNYPGLAFLPPTLDRHLFTAFVQDEISFYEERLKVTIGSKFEHNDFTGFEVQPSGRVAWSGARYTLWSSISRAVRTPSRLDRHLFAPESPPFTFAGGPDFVSEEVVAYELGARVQPHEKVFLTVSPFSNEYDNLRSLSTPPPIVTENSVEGETYGVELEATWQTTDWWRLMAGYTFFKSRFRVKPGQTDLNDGQGEAFDPEHQFQLRSSMNLPRDIEFDLWFRYVDEIGNEARGFTVVPAYSTLDARIAWRPRENLQLSVVGQHLLEERHREFGSNEIERAVYAKVDWRL